MQVKIDGFAEDKGEKSAGLPAGKYKFMNTTVADGVTGPQSKTPGRPLIKVTCTVFDHPEHSGRVMFLNFPIPDKATDDEKAFNFMRSNLKRFCNACGLNSESAEFDTSDLQNCRFTGIVATKDDRSEIKDYLTLEE